MVVRELNALIDKILDRIGGEITGFRRIITVGFGSDRGFKMIGERTACAQFLGRLVRMCEFMRNRRALGSDQHDQQCCPCQSCQER